MPGYEGLVHISELDSKKIAAPEKVFTVGQPIDVKYLGKNEKGQMRLSRRAVLMRDSTTPNSMPDSNSPQSPPAPAPAGEPKPPSVTSLAESAYN